MGHLSNLLLVGASLVRAILPLRLLLIASGLCAVAYSVATGDRVSAPWQALFVAVNVIQIGMLFRERQRARLTLEEEALRAKCFPALSVVEFHRLVRAGGWHTAGAGSRLTVQDRHVPHLLLMVEGAASVRIGGKSVGRCLPGDFVGEMAFVSGRPASATVVTSEPSRYLAWGIDPLGELMERSPEIRTALQARFSLNLSDKLLRDPGSAVGGESTSTARTTDP